MRKYPLRSALFVLLLAALSACQTAAPAAPAQATPGAPSSPDTGAVAPGQFMSLGSVVVSQSGQSPDYTIKVRTPVMNGSNDPNVVAFNKLVSQLIQKQTTDFRKNLAELTPVPFSTGSTFDLEYTLVGQSAQIVSLQLKTDVYMAGAAHPFQTSTSVNFDLGQGQAIRLDQLFAPGANYLQAISDYCKKTLNQTDLASSLFPEGLAPTADNYRNWNLSSQGLVITFDEYQVAPYAAGPQTVVIPYAALKEMLAPHGPAAQFIQ